MKKTVTQKNTSNKGVVNPFQLTKKTTSTKSVIKCNQEYVNKSTGEIEEMQVIQVNESADVNFHKLWLGHILSTLDIIGNKKIQVLNYVLSNIDSKNQFIATYQKIIDDTGVSRGTVNETMQGLKNSNFLVSVQQGVYKINPDIIFKGNNKSRLNVLLQYSKAVEEQENKTKKEPQEDPLPGQTTIGDLKEA